MSCHSPITDCELEALAEAVESTLSASGTIYRRTRASDSAGGHTGTFAAIGTAAFDVIRGNTFERNIGDQIVSVQEFKGWLPIGTNIAATDRVLCGGQVYEVTGHDAGAPTASAITLRLVKVAG